MMGRLRAMREPLKYVQGRDATLKFHEEMGYMGKRWLFVCSNSGYKACHDKIEKSFGELDDYRRYEVFGGISSKGEIAKMEEIVKADNIDTVVAVGGGSAVILQKLQHTTQASTLLSCLQLRQQMRHAQVCQ